MPVEPALDETRRVRIDDLVVDDGAGPCDVRRAARARGARFRRRYGSAKDDRETDGNDRDHRADREPSCLPPTHRPLLLWCRPNRPRMRGVPAKDARDPVAVAAVDPSPQGRAEFDERALRCYKSMPARFGLP